MCECVFHLFLFKTEVLAKDGVDFGKGRVTREQQVSGVGIIRGYVTQDETHSNNDVLY